MEKKKKNGIFFFLWNLMNQKKPVKLNNGKLGDNKQDGEQ